MTPGNRYLDLSTDALEVALLRAHDAQDGRALTEIYAEAAMRVNEIDNKAFLLTQAYVFALENHHPARDEIHARLVLLGREAPVGPPRPPNR